MQIGLTVPDRASDNEKAAAFRAALEAATLANLALASAGQLPDLRDAIRTGAVRWRPEPKGQERFDLATTVAGRGWGDCDDLAPWWAAQLRHTGRDPMARADVRRTGARTWHAFVRRGDGSTEDPSRAAGMPHRARGGVALISGPTDRALALQCIPSGRPGHFMCSLQNPMPDAPGALVGLAFGSTPGRAARRASYVHELLHGEGIMGEEIGFLPGIAAALPIASAALPMAQGILSKFGFGGGGGGGQPAPPAGGGGGAPQVVPAGGGGYGYGPVIVRF